MTIASVTSSSAVSQASWVSQVQQNSGAGSAGPAHRPPPPPDGGALLGAVADALQSIGVTTTGAADDGSATNTTASADTQGNAAQALGSFLHELMGALHQQGAAAQGDGQGGPPPDGQAYGPPGGGGPGGPGRLAADLHSLISKLGSSSTDSTDTTDSTASTGATDSTDSTDTASTTLESAFENLLQALGSDTSGAGGKLASFLQTLADKLPGAGSSGNLINTSV